VGVIKKCPTWDASTSGRTVLPIFGGRRAIAAEEAGASSFGPLTSLLCAYCVYSFLRIDGHENAKR
jgi:hypothetical protein